MDLSRLRHVLDRLAGRSNTPPGTMIGPRTTISPRTILERSHGRHISIGAATTIVDGAMMLCHDTSSYRRIGVTRLAPVALGESVLVGARAIIMPGVTIGDDAVPAADAVVTRDAPARTVVVGVPAVMTKTVGTLDGERQTELRTSVVFDESTHNVPPHPPHVACDLTAPH